MVHSSATEYRPCILSPRYWTLPLMSLYLQCWPPFGTSKGTSFIIHHGQRHCALGQSKFSNWRPRNTTMVYGMMWVTMTRVLQRQSMSWSHSTTTLCYRRQWRGHICCSYHKRIQLMTAPSIITIAWTMTTPMMMQKMTWQRPPFPPPQFFSGFFNNIRCLFYDKISHKWIPRF